MKNDQLIKNIRDRLVAIIAAVGCAFAVWYFFDLYYDMNDDVLIKDILAGTYTGSPDGHCIQMLYPLGAFLAFLQNVIPNIAGSNVPWFGLFLCGMHVLCCFFIIQRAMQFAGKFWGKLIILATGIVMSCALMLYSFVYVQYTITAGVLSATGIFLYCTTRDDLKPASFIIRNIPSILFITLSFYIRTEMMLLLCPLMLVAGLFKWFYGSKGTGQKPFHHENIQRFLVVPVIILTLMGIGFVGDKLAYGDEDWRSFNTFFDERTELYDFQSGAPDYSSNQDLYNSLGLSESEVELFNNYNFALDNHIDEEVVGAITKYNREVLGEGYFRLSVGEVFAEYLHRIVGKQDAPYVYVVWLLYLLIIALGALQLDLTMVVKVLAMLIARSISWVYIIARGRTPDRITIPLYLCEILVLLGLFLMSSKGLLADYNKQPEKNQMYKRTFPIMAALLLVVLTAIPCYQMVVKTGEEMNRRSEVNTEWYALKDYFADNPESFYVLDVYSTVKYSEMIMEDVDNSYRNYEICGGWGAKSPLYMEKLKKMGFSDLQADLVNRSNMYFVINCEQDMDWLVAFYKDKGFDVSLDVNGILKVDDEQKFVIYKVRLNA